MCIVVVAAHENGCLSSESFALWQAACQLRAQTGAPIAVWVLGQDCGMACTQAVRVFSDAHLILQVEDPVLAHPVAAVFVHALALCLSHSDLPVQYMIMSANHWGKDVLPRLAGVLGVAPVTDVIAIAGPDTFVRPIYAGNAYQTLVSEQTLHLLTVRTCAFLGGATVGHAVSGKAALDQQDNTRPPIVSFSLSHPAVQRASPRQCEWDWDAVAQIMDRTAWLCMHGPDRHTRDITQAAIVIGGGRGLQSKENFCQLEALAERLGAAVGATRAAVDAGFAPNVYQIGQTGKVIAPRLYIAVGISGAIQHIAGIRDSQCIVAINTDPNAPIFDVADYGLVADALAVLPQWYAALAST